MNWGTGVREVAREGSDGLLVARARAGDNDAFAALVGRYQAFLHQVVQARVRQPEVAEDLVQEVFCKAYQKLSTLADDEQVSHWLARMAANTAVQWQRGQQVWKRVQARGWLVPVGCPPVLPDEVLEIRERRAQVQAAIARLSPADWQVVVLYYLEGCTCREISQTLGVAREAVKCRLYHARGRLRKELARAD